ncbi:unnamed protein product [Leptosia nina]|uniref:Uncharacterized protein n=1 Tax=Leptosia nina TaxID=320188 RepID=A0AAV1JSF6_9NEOP
MRLSNRRQGEVMFNKYSIENKLTKKVLGGGMAKLGSGDVPLNTLAAVYSSPSARTWRCETVFILILNHCSPGAVVCTNYPRGLCEVSTDELSTRPLLGLLKIHITSSFL